MLMFLHGPDSFRLHERLETLRQGFVSKYDANSVGLETLVASELDPQVLPSKLLSGGLFTTKRCVVITEIFKLKPQVVDVFLALLPRCGADTIVIATASELPKTDAKTESPLLPVLLKADRVEAFPLLDPTQLSKWLKERVQKLHATIEPTAVHYLVQAIGSDGWRMSGVVEQLTHYDKNISLKNAELFVASPLDDNIFHLTDALSERHASAALKVLHDQMESGANPFYILTMLARQITILLQVKSGGEAAKKLHPYVQKKSALHARRFSMEQLTTLYGKVVRVDEQLKTTSLEPAVVLDKLVAELCLS